MTPEQKYALIGAAVGGIAGGLGGSGDTQGSQGYTKGIPSYKANRELVPNAFTPTYQATVPGQTEPTTFERRPGMVGRRYFTDVNYVQDTEQPIMGGAELAAMNQAALDRQQEVVDLGKGIYDSYQQKLIDDAAGTTGTTLTGTTLTGTTPTGTTLTGTTPTGTTPTGTTTTAYDTFANSLKGRELTAEDAAAIVASGYSLNDLASTLSTATMPIDALALRNFINYYTNGFTTTDDGKVGTTGMGNLLVSLGGTRNADGTITDATGGTYSIQDGAWRPVSGGGETVTDATTLTGDTTTDTTTTDSTYTNFINSLRGRELTDADAAAIAASGYSLNDIASALSTATNPIDPLALRNFINYYTNGFTTTDDGKVGTTGMGNLLVSLGGTRNADGTITDATGGTYSIQDGAWRPVAATTGTTTTGTTTTGTAPTAYDNFIASYAAKDVADFTAADYTALASSGYALSDIATSLNVTESSLAKALDRYSPENVAFQNFMDSLPATLSSAEDAQALLNSGYSLEKIASGYTNITASQLQAFIDGFDTPTTTGTTTTGTTTTDTTGADAVETLLNSTEQWMVANRGYVDNGDGTITDSTNGYVYDADTGKGFFPTTDTAGAGTDIVDTLTGTTDTADTTASSLELFAQNNAGKTLTSEDLVALNNLSGEGYTAQEVIDTLGLKDADGNPISEAQLNSTLNRAVGTNTLNTIVADTDGLDGDQVSDIAGLITSNTFGISDVAEEFGVSDAEVIAGLIRGDYLTPAQIADRYEDLSEADLVSILLSEDLTTPAEVAAYYNIPESEVRSYARSNYGLDLAGGGYLGYAQGGMAQGRGYYLGGTTDGMADEVPATIDGNQPARLSDGEFVIPADVVSHLGNGNSDAGAQELYGMMDRVRTDRTGNPNQGRQIDPNKYLA